MNDENELIDAFLEPRSSDNVPAQYAHDLAHIANRLRAERDACRVYSAEFTKRIKELTVENAHLRLAVEGLKEESRELRATIEQARNQRPEGNDCFGCHGTGEERDPRFGEVLTCPSCEGTGADNVYDELRRVQKILDAVVHLENAKEES